MDLIGEYINGNYTVKIYEDGTKIRETKEDEFISSFPESIDLKITNRCNMGCPYCHEDSTLVGKHGNIFAKFIDTLRPYTEVALGGGNVLEHPHLISLLKKFKNNKVIANMTVNQYHFMAYKDIIDYLIKHDLIKGLGVSLMESNNEFIHEIKKYEHAVIHVINGIVTMDDIEKLYGNNLKILILGYKELRRGEDYYSDEIERNKQLMYNNLGWVIKGFDIVSFDNLAINQLELRRFFKDGFWNEFYMGDEGQFTMYIDLVEEEFAESSTSQVRFTLSDNIDDMFKTVKECRNI